MAERTATHLLLNRGLFLGLCLLLIYVQILPLETTPRRWTGPDMLVVMSVAWTLRRPEYAPAWLLAGVMLLGDFLFMRPPGLFSALTVILCEFMRRRSVLLRDTAFAIEWLSATGAIVALALGNRLIMTIFFIEQVPLGLTLIQMIMSILCYPLVVLFAWAFLGLRKAAPGDLNALGGRP